MTLEEIRRRKKETGLTNRMLADRSGVPLGTVQKLMSGATKSPRYETLRALEKALEEQEGRTPGEGERRSFRYSDEIRAGEGDPLLREGGQWYEYGSVSQKKHQGQFTVEDIFALPENVRAELIDGVMYDMAEPTLLHQAIAGYIHSQFLSYIRRKKGSCFPFMAPVGVQLDRDERTLVEPDVLVVCRKEEEDRIRKRVIFGAPDFVLEVISPASVRRDTIIKMKKYRDAGVREYWLIDPAAKVLQVYDFVNESGNIVYLYNFNNKVPVRIWDGDLEIDLAEMYESLIWLYERS